MGALVQQSRVWCVPISTPVPSPSTRGRLMEPQVSCCSVGAAHDCLQDNSLDGTSCKPVLGATIDLCLRNPLSRPPLAQLEVKKSAMTKLDAEQSGWLSYC